MFHLEITRDAHSPREPIVRRRFRSPERARAAFTAAVAEVAGLPTPYVVLHRAPDPGMSAWPVLAEHTKRGTHHGRGWGRMTGGESR